MDLIISNNDKRPIYEQITSQIEMLIVKKELVSGQALPSIRQLAKELRISVITVQHAYEELIRDGFIETVPGKGTFVSQIDIDFIKEEQTRKIENRLKKVVELSKEYDISYEQLTLLLKKLY